MKLRRFLSIALTELCGHKTFQDFWLLGELRAIRK